jgi:hypothetical protein
MDVEIEEKSNAHPAHKTLKTLWYSERNYLWAQILISGIKICLFRVLQELYRSSIFNRTWAALVP